MALVFISYRRNDSSGHAGRIHDHLNRALFLTDGDLVLDSDLFLDVGSIEPGTDWAKVIEEELSNCAVLLVVIGSRWNVSKYVREEILTAIKNNIEIIPVLVDGADLPNSENLPEELAPLKDKQAHHLSHTDNAAWLSDAERLVEKIRKSLNSSLTERTLKKITVVTIFRNDSSNYWKYDDGYSVNGYGLIPVSFIEDFGLENPDFAKLNHVPMPSSIEKALIHKGGSQDFVTRPGKISFQLGFSKVTSSPNASVSTEGKSKAWQGHLKPGKYRFECGRVVDWKKTASRIGLSILGWPNGKVDLFLNLSKYEEWPKDQRQLTKREQATIKFGRIMLTESEKE